MPATELALFESDRGRSSAAGYGRQLSKADGDGAAWVSPTFVVHGVKCRMVMDQRAINTLLATRLFRHHWLARFLSSVLPNEHLVSWDVKDTFYHIRICPTHCMHFQLVVDGVVYEPRVLPFGMTLSPCAWTQGGASCVRLLAAQGHPRARVRGQLRMNVAGRAAILGGVGHSRPLRDCAAICGLGPALERHQGGGSRYEAAAHPWVSVRHPAAALAAAQGKAGKDRPGRRGPAACSTDGQPPRAGQGSLLLNGPRRLVLTCSALHPVLPVELVLRAAPRHRHHQGVRQSRVRPGQMRWAAPKAGRWVGPLALPGGAPHDGCVVLGMGRPLRRPFLPAAGFFTLEQQNMHINVKEARAVHLCLLAFSLQLTRPLGVLRLRVDGHVTMHVIQPFSSSSPAVMEEL